MMAMCIKMAKWYESLRCFINCKKRERGRRGGGGGGGRQRGQAISIKTRGRWGGGGGNGSVHYSMFV